MPVVKASDLRIGFDRQPKIEKHSISDILQGDYHLAVGSSWHKALRITRRSIAIALSKTAEQPNSEQLREPSHTLSIYTKQHIKILYRDTM